MTNLILQWCGIVWMACVTMLYYETDYTWCETSASQIRPCIGCGHWWVKYPELLCESCRISKD